jgi:hypothetical protein
MTNSLWSITLMSKKIMFMSFTCLAFSISVSSDFPCTAHAFFPKHLSDHCQSLHCTFLRFAQNLMLFLCRIHCEITPGQIHDSK